MTGKLINPATGKPFVSANPSSQIRSLREEIMYTLGNRSNLQGSYDASKTTMQNQQHWLPANNLSPHAVNNLSTRQTLRNRSRYEGANSGYLKGIGLSLCQDFVGSCPTLQITDPRFQLPNKSGSSSNSDRNGSSNNGSTSPKKTQLSPAQIVEKIWKLRAKKIKLRKKLWRLRHEKLFAGEGFAFSFNNRTLKHKVTVDQRIFEADQVSHFTMQIKPSNNKLEIDGVRFDRVSGEPTHYHLLYDHPGENQFMNFKGTKTDGKWIRAENVIHWYRQDRGWLRGIPETTYTLPLWALLRRYTLAVVQNAEIAADFTVLLKTMQLPFATGFGNNATTGEPTQTDKELWFAGMPVDRGMMTALPDNYDLTQLRPEQPVTVYDSFVAALVGEASRPLLTPRNVAMNNSGEYNMSSGVQDRQTYREAIKQERYDAEDEVLDVDLNQWWYEAVRTPNYFDNYYGTMAGDGDSLSRSEITTIKQIIGRYPDLKEEPPEHCYRWDEVPEHTDPYKVAQSVDLLFQAGHLTDKDIQEGRFNRSVEDHHEDRRQQLAREQQLRNEFPDILTEPEPPEQIIPSNAPANKNGDSKKNGKNNGTKKLVTANRFSNHDDEDDED